MRKQFIRHEHLRSLLSEVEIHKEDTPEETLDRVVDEIRHSCFIIAGNISGDEIKIPTVTTRLGEFGLLFTDMDEYKKVFPDFDVQSKEHPIGVYIGMASKSDLSGFILNIESEGLILNDELLGNLDDVPEIEFSCDNAYTSEELKELKNSINNSGLEEFINNPDNIGKYEELFDEISASTLLTLMLSRDNLESRAEDGIISVENKPLGFLYIDEVGGNYATVYTSEEKIANVTTPLNKYSQLVNFSQMTNFILNDDMDGIIINPNSENIMLTRDVLLEYSDLLEEKCNNEKLNSAIFHMFTMEV